MPIPAPEPPRATPEFVTGIDVGWWVCPCGNEPYFDGFSPCDGAGQPLDPGSDRWDQQTNVCRACGRILNQDTGQVLGRRPMPYDSDDE